jgi:uncharacterized protein YegL
VRLTILVMVLLIAGLCIMSCSKEGPLQSIPESNPVLTQQRQVFDTEVVEGMDPYPSHRPPIVKDFSGGNRLLDETEVNIEITDPPDGSSTEDECITVTGTASAVGGAAIDLHLILDTSGSLGSTDPDDFREEAAVALIQSFSPLANLRIGTIDFDEDAFIASPLTLIGDDLGAAAIAAIHNMDRSGNTDIGEAITLAVNDFIANGLPGASRISILFSDGAPTEGDALGAADYARTNNVVVNTVFLGSGAGAALMQQIADTTNGFYLSTDDPQDLIEIFGSIPGTGIDSVVVNGVKANLVTGVFDAYICLDCGLNEIVAVATAIDGTTGSDTIYVTRECEVEVPFDIKPTSCPNPLNMKSNGVLPAAILGTMDFDVTLIDPETITLAGVAPVRWNYQDVATPYVPFAGKEDCLDCNEAGADGMLDLTLKFDKQAIVAALHDVEDRDCVVLTVNGMLYDGTPIVGEDVVRIQISTNQPGGKNASGRQ